MRGALLSLGRTAGVGWRLMLGLWSGCGRILRTGRGLWLRTRLGGFPRVFVVVLSLVDVVELVFWWRRLLVWLGGRLLLGIVELYRWQLGGLFFIIIRLDGSFGVWLFNPFFGSGKARVFGGVLLQIFVSLPVIYGFIAEVFLDIGVELSYLPNGFNPLGLVFNKIVGEIVLIVINPSVNDGRISGMRVSRAVIVVDIVVSEVRIVMPMLGIVKIPVSKVIRRHSDNNEVAISVVIIAAIKPKRVRIPVRIGIPCRITKPIGVWIASVGSNVVRTWGNVNFILRIAVFFGIFFAGTFKIGGIFGIILDGLFPLLDFLCIFAGLGKVCGVSLVNNTLRVSLITVTNSNG